MRSSTVGAVGRPPKEPAAGMQRISIVVTLLLAVVLLFSIRSIHAILSSQTLQYEAERWRGASEQTYSQVSVFWNEGEMDVSQAETLTTELRAAFPTEEIPPFVTAWGTKSSGLAAYERRTAETELWYVSKDFFTLHSFPMTEGGAASFASDGTEAILNEAAAYALFGSFHCLGEYVQINDAGRRVIAVLKEPDDAANKSAFGNTPRIYLPITEDAEVSFYEAVLPEYYGGYAAQRLQNATGQVVTSSTGRFRLSRLWKKAKSFFQAPPEATPPFPPWEQAARLAERKLCAWQCILTLSNILLLWLLIKFALLLFAKSSLKKQR
jgi:hypothetical protein